MTRISILFAILVLLAIASPALAEDAGENNQKNWPAAAGILLGASLLLLLPIATLLRATRSLPESLAIRIADRPWMTLAVGAVNLIVLLAISSVGGPISGLIGLVLILGTFFGLTGVAADLAGRLTKREDPGVGLFAVAWIVIAGSALVPIIGLGVFLWLTAKGVGALVLGFIPARQAPPETVPPKDAEDDGDDGDA